MKSLLALAGSLLFSLVLYCVGYWGLLDFPTRFFFLDRIVDAKVARLKAARDEPKFVVFSGSNGHFSHSCKIIEAAIDRTCINAGTTIVYDIGHVGRELRATLRPGDIVYMPVEYEFFEVYHSPLRVGRDALATVTRDWSRLAEMPLHRRVAALLYLDFSFALRAIYDRLYWETRMREATRRLPPLTGSDAHVVTAEAASHHAWWIRIQPSVVARLDRIDFEGASYAHRLGDFLDWCRRHGVTVIGGLPVVFDDRPVPDAVVDRMRRLFTARGHRFLVLENRSQYPRALFYDKEYHVTDAVRTRHTHALVRKLIAEGLVEPRKAAPK